MVEKIIGYKTSLDDKQLFKTEKAAQQHETYLTLMSSSKATTIAGFAAEISENKELATRIIEILERNI
jgi:hypothetical protein